jgi:uncharacterized membrane protein (DUF106 family)
MIEWLNNNLVVILGALLVSIISIIGEFLLIKLKLVNLKKIIENKEKIKKLNEELKETYNKVKQEKTGIDPSIMEKQKEILSLNFEIMKEKFKITFLTAIPVLLIFSYIYKVKGGFGWWFLTYLIAYFIFDKIFRKLAKICKVEIDYS